jgi:hypothetical protein
MEGPAVVLLGRAKSGRAEAAILFCLTTDAAPISDVSDRLLSNNVNIYTITYLKEAEIYGTPHDVGPQGNPAV